MALQRRAPASRPGAGWVGSADDKRTTAAEHLGAFLRRLHDIPAGSLGSVLPRRPERSDASRGMQRDLDRLRQVKLAGIWEVPTQALDLVELAASLGPARELVVSHGDLHVRHLLVDEHGEATGVIDWGEVGLLHPSSDFHIAYSGFAGAARAAFFAEYGDVPDAWHRRARASALLYSVTLALYARSTSQRTLEREAVRGIERVMRDENGASP